MDAKFLDAKIEKLFIFYDFLTIEIERQGEFLTQSMRSLFLSRKISFEKLSS